MSANKETIAQWIREKKTALGIEFGSTRIKAVLVGEDHTPIASGAHDWENRLTDGIWTYTLEDIWTGIQDAYAKLAEDVKRQYGETLHAVGGIGISAMMHGYMVFDKAGELLVPFRTWRNTITAEASEKLTELFAYPIPQRWSIAHLYQAILNGEPHVPDIDYMITLEGYVHWKLTGQKVLGIGDVAGMFPVDIHNHDFDQKMVEKFDALVADKGYSWKLRDILPKALVAGEDAGSLTAEGAKLLDVTGNVSAGTSVFAMVVLEKELKKVHPEIDLVTTPAGDLVGMVHCNNCTSDLNAWVGLFREFMESMGMEVDMNRLFGVLYNKALEGDKDCGGLLAYNYFSGEHITGFEEGRPLFVRRPDDKFNLANFMRTHLYTSLGALKTGLDILFRDEQVKLDVLLGHGGLFKTKGVGQKIMAAAAGVPVEVMETAGEGGAWGAALLAAYRVWKEDGETLDAYLEKKVFGGQHGTVMEPDAEDVKGFDEFMVRYHAGLPIERAAVETMPEK